MLLNIYNIYIIYKLYMIENASQRFRYHNDVALFFCLSYISHEAST